MHIERNGMATIYLAGGLFNAGERWHNLCLKRALEKLEYEVILPQDRALKFFDGKKFDLDAIVRDCQSWTLNKDVITVVCLDGADADSGSAVEYGLAMAKNGRAIVYRTDFRTAMDCECGFNAMFRCQGTKIIYEPAYFVDEDGATNFYLSLAFQIDWAVHTIELG